MFQVRWPSQYRDTAVPCWYRHPSAVEAWSALYTSWDWAMHDKHSNPVRVSDWLVVNMPNLVRVIEAELNRCKTSGKGHQEPTPLGPNQLDDDAELSAFIEAELAARPPVPAEDAPAS